MARTWGGAGQDVPVDINFRYPESHPSMPILAVPGWTQSSGLETQGRGFNGGTVDGFLQIQFDPSDPYIRRYLGPSPTYNLPLASDVSPAGSIALGGYATSATTGTAFLKTVGRYGNDINTLFAGAVGSGNDMDFNDVIAKPFWRVGYGKTFGLPELTDDAFQNALAGPPDIVLQKHGPPTFLGQFVNLTDRDIVLGPTDRFPYPVVRPFSATPLIEWPNGPFDIEINPGTLTSQTRMFDTEDHAHLRYYFNTGTDVVSIAAPEIGRFWERGTPSHIPTVFFNNGPNALHIRSVADAPDTPPILTLPGGGSSDALLAPGEYEVYGEGVDFVEPRRYFLGARLRFVAAEKTDDSHASVERFPLPYLTVFTQSEAASSNAAASIDVLVLGPEGEQRSLVAPVANEPDAAIPARMVLHAAYPNPFNPSTQITFDLEKSMDVALAVYDVSGRRVRELLKGARQAGSHSIVWDARNDAGTEVASGRYIIRLEGGDQVVSTRVVLQR